MHRANHRIRFGGYQREAPIAVNACEKQQGFLGARELIAGFDLLSRFSAAYGFCAVGLEKGRGGHQAAAL